MKSAESAQLHAAAASTAPGSVSPAPRWLRLYLLLLSLSLAVCALSFFVFSLRWPLVGDASLLHEMASLIERGWAPYRQFNDMDMPGAFLVELGAMRVFGPNALGLRFFDFFLVLSAAAAFFVIARRPALARLPQRLAALFAASLFLLIHGRDGLAQAGQRDLTIAVCQLVATAFLFHAVRRPAARGARTRLWPVFAFGLLSGVAFTVKPTALLLPVLQLALAAFALRQPAPAAFPGTVSGPSPGEQVSPPARVAGWLAPVRVAGWLAPVFGWLVAPAACLVFLSREHAVSAFLYTLRAVVPYYASLGHRSVGYTLNHSFSPILPLLLVWIAVLALAPARLRIPEPARLRLWDWERFALFAGVFSGLLSCLLQQRALPYHRYPLLGFLLPLLALDLLAAMTPVPSPAQPPRTRFAALLAAAGLAYGALVLAPQSALLIHSFRWYQTDLLDSLELQLARLGGSALSGKIQCIDWISGCQTVLYRMRLEPATGTLNDFLLFGPADVAPVRDAQAALQRSLLAHPPEVIVVTSYLHLAAPADANNFHKLARWPTLTGILASRYTLTAEWSPTRPERWWSREEYPASYRIYTLRPPSP